MQTLGAMKVNNFSKKYKLYESIVKGNEVNKSKQQNKGEEEHHKKEK